MSFLTKYKQYGFKNFLQRLVLSGLSRVGIRIDEWLICTQVINSEALELNKPSLVEGYHVKELNLIDFESSKLFDNIRLATINERFADPFLKAYGVYANNNLAYYCWISLKEFQFSKKLYSMEMEPSQGLLFDAFCFENHRGKGLHNYMNIFRLSKLLELGKDEAVAVILKQNVPARKSQSKAGFIYRKLIITCEIFGNKRIITSNRKINL